MKLVITPLARDRRPVLVPVVPRVSVYDNEDPTGEAFRSEPAQFTLETNAPWSKAMGDFIAESLAALYKELGIAATWTNTAVPCTRVELTVAVNDGPPQLLTWAHYWPLPSGPSAPWVEEYTILIGMKDIVTELEALWKGEPCT